MLVVWRAPQARSTLDIDLLGRVNNQEEEIVARIRDVLSVSAQADGLEFDLDSIRTERIAEQADYAGVRIRFRASLASARIQLQLDIGFGDIVYPQPEKLPLPTILDLPAPLLLCYSRESTVAEKLEAMVRFGMLNSRMKDFYDLWWLSRRFDFDGDKLTEAIRLTFARRGTDLPAKIEPFTGSFVSAGRRLWTAFRKRLRPQDAPEDFAQVVAALDGFLSPVIATLTLGAPVPGKWFAPGPWI